ncbi:tol-pal system protein YbgF [candidate division KSB1 bacterium]|nr:tol-pal system protein YbgF [candidate division KSB1 bacterium]
MKTQRIIIGCFALALAVTGCASRKQFFDLQQQNAEIERGLDSVRAETKRMAAALETLGADLHSYTSQSQYGSTTLEEKVEGLAARLDDIVQRMDRSLAPLQEWLQQQDTGTTGSNSGSGIDYYDAAQKDLALGNYDLAEVGFLQYLESNPQSDLADDARYGLGETYYARKQYDEAVEQYQRVIDMDAAGPKAPAAMLKLGLCYRADQQTGEARKVWESLIKQYPQSEESRVARQRIDELESSR